MSAPQLTASTRLFNLPGHTANVRSYEVRHTGRIGEQMFSHGEHLLLDGAANDGDLVVLAAKGPGRPRLGRVSGTGLVGDRGEPCSHSRWVVAGRVIGVARPLAGGWSVEQFASPTIVGILPVAHPTDERVVARPEVARGQLSLFAA